VSDVDAEGVRTQSVGHVLVVTLDRPGSRNAIDHTMSAGLRSAMERLDADQELRVAVIAGANGTFCSGMDLKAFASGEIQVGNGAGGGVLPKVSKPLIAAVEGWAVAGGCELAMACDIVIASRDARFGLPEVKHGLVAFGGGLRRIAAMVPYGRAIEMALTGDPVGATELHAWGLVSHLTEPGQSMEVALELSQRIAANPPRAVVATRSLLQSASFMDERVFDEAQRSTREEIFASGEALAGARAFTKTNQASRPAP
jgi:enoyl-CoA hydratase